mgnify:CR=1 FL=1
MGVLTHNLGGAGRDEIDQPDLMNNKIRQVFN